MTKTILYARVSTAEQTLEHQTEQARKAGFEVDEVLSDHGVSGVNTMLRNRENGKRLFDILRKGDILVVRWIDRLGRNYEDVTETMRDFLDRGVTIKTVTSNMTFDAQPKSDMDRAVRDAMLAFMAAQASAQVIAMKEAQKAGIAHAKATKPKMFRGRRPTYTAGQLEQVVSLHQAGTAKAAIAREVGLQRITVQRLIANPQGAQEALKRWADD